LTVSQALSFTHHTYLGILRVRSFKNVTKKQLRVFVHDGPGESIALVGAEIMTVPPSATDELFKVIARIELLVVGREIVQNLRCCMDAGWSEAQLRLAHF
jgi:hypothetical protein